MGKRFSLSIVFVCLAAVHCVQAVFSSYGYMNECLQHTESDPCNVTTEMLCIPSNDDYNCHGDSSSPISRIIQHDTGYNFFFKRSAVTVTKDISRITITELSLCEEEVLKLTLSDLTCGATCTTMITPDVANTLTAVCDSNMVLSGNYSVVMLSPQNTKMQSCHMDSLNFVIVDTDSEFKRINLHNYDFTLFCDCNRCE